MSLRNVRKSSRERRALGPLLAPLDELTRGSEHLFSAPVPYLDSRGLTQALPKYLFAGPGDRRSYLRVGIFGGLHGDEESGVLAAIALLERLHAQPALAAGYELFVYPVCNPEGFGDGTRWMRSGADMNRQFWRHSTEPEVRVIEGQLRHLRFDGLIALHSDDTSDGIYGFVCGHQLTRHVLEPALEEAGRILPRNFDKSIDNFEANNGIIEQGYEGVLGAPPGQSPRPFEVVFETPHRAPLADQVAAHTAAVLAILDRFKTLISEGQGI